MVETAAKYGINSDRAVNYHADAKGTRVLYDAVAFAASNVREGEQLGSAWSAPINADFNSRKK